MRDLFSLHSALALACLGIAGCAASSDGQVIVRTVSDRTGLGMGGIKVQVADQPWATTDANGVATFAGVGPTYTLRAHQMVAFAVPFHEVFVLEGQTQRELVIDVDGNPGTLSPPHTPTWSDAEISGTVQGRTQPVSSASTRTQVSYRGTWLSGPVAADGTFDFGVLIQSPATSVTLRAYEVREGGPSPAGPGTTGSGTAAELFASGSTTVALTGGGHATGVSVALRPATRGTVTATASVAPALAGSDVLAWSSIGFGRYDPDAVLFETATVPPGGFSLPVFGAEGGETWVTVFSTKPGVGFARHRRRVSLPEATVAFQLAAPAQLTEPAAGATIDMATVFRWTRTATDGRAELYLSCSSAAQDVAYRVSTAASEVTLPSVPDVSLPAGAPCVWQVSSHAVTDATVEESSSTTVLRTAATR